MVSLRSALLLPKSSSRHAACNHLLRGRAVRSPYEEVPSFVEEQHALFADRRGSACLKPDLGVGAVTRPPRDLAGSSRAGKTESRLVVRGSSGYGEPHRSVSPARRRPTDPSLWRAPAIPSPRPKKNVPPTSTGG